MKKLLAIVLVVGMIMSLAACSVSESASSSSNTSAKTESKADAKTESKADSKATESKAAAEAKDSGKLSDNNVAIESARLSQDYKKKPVIVVKYKFTNNGEKTTSFAAAIMGKAFQDGVELETAIIGDDKQYNAANYMKEIKKGASLEVECVYSLTNQKSKVEVEAAELFDMNDNEKLTKDFDVTKLK